MGSNKSPFFVDIMAMNSGVTGSCNLCVVRFPNERTVKFLVDCGMYQGEEDCDKMNANFDFDPRDINFVLITHGHIDHIGRLPHLVKHGFSGEIYATRDTAKNIMPRALKDSYKIAISTASKQAKPLYAEKDVTTVLYSTRTFEYESCHVLEENIYVTYFRNIHIVGAALILVRIKYQGYDDINFLFTGDYNCKNIFLDETVLPPWVQNLPLTVVQEATYGTTTSSEVEEVFEEKVRQAALDGKTIVLPSYSLGRTQDVLYKLKRMQISGKIDPGIPIYLDGKLGIGYTTNYLKFDIRRDMRDFLPTNLTIVYKALRADLYMQRMCKIIVAASGSGSYGPVREYITEFLPSRKALILFTGYTPAGSLGHLLKITRSKEKVKCFGMELVKKAEIDYTSEFSAHAKADELIDFLKQFNRLQLVLVEHGQPCTKEAYVGLVKRKVTAKEVHILDRRFCYRINAYGYVKTIASKFK